LMLWLQGVRVRSIADQDARRDMGVLAAMSQDQLNEFVATIARAYDLQLVFTVRNGDLVAPLFVPSGGVFKITYPDEGCLSGHAVGVGLPLAPSCALVATPSDQHGKADLSRLPGSIANCSVGTSDSRRVVVFPTGIANGTNDLLRRTLHELRELNDLLVAAVQEARDLVIGMFDTAGLPVARDESGRLRPPKI
jgi:hypothetical protein